METPEISIVIPSLNAKDLLTELLPNLTAVARKHRHGAEVIVVDDGSIDGTSQFIQTTYPTVHLARSDVNRGFSHACNLGASCAKAKIIFFLNTDVEVTEGFLGPIARHFEEQDVFGVRANVMKPMDRDSFEQRVPLYWEFRYGIVRLSHEIFKGKARMEKEYANVGGSHGAVSKEKFLELDGFDELYCPFYMEDLDLSYRALKRGWKIRYEPKSVVIHRGGGTIRRFFEANYVTLIGERNQYLFVWKNIGDRRLLLLHFCWLPIRFLRSLLKGNLLPLKAFFLAVARTRDVHQRRREEKRHCRVRDREIFQKFKKPRAKC